MAETRPGGRTRSIPKEHRGAHVPAPASTTTVEAVFGQPAPKRKGFSAYSQQVEQTVTPAGLTPVEPAPPARSALQPGDVLDLYPTIVTYEEYKPRQYREAGMIEREDKYELVRIREFPGRRPIYEFRRLNQEGPIQRTTLVKPIGPGKGWVTATKTK